MSAAAAAVRIDAGIERCSERYDQVAIPVVTSAAASSARQPDDQARAKWMAAVLPETLVRY
jgi:hypothetical protein